MTRNPISGVAAMEGTIDLGVAPMSRPVFNVSQSGDPIPTWDKAPRFLESPTCRCRFRLFSPTPQRCDRSSIALCTCLTKGSLTPRIQARAIAQRTDRGEFQPGRTFGHDPPIVSVFGH